MVMWASAVACSFMAIQNDGKSVSDQWWERMGTVLIGGMIFAAISTVRDETKPQKE